MKDRVGIGFIGAGGIARQRHLPGLKAIDGVELVAVANRNRESSERVAKEWGFASAKAEWRQILDMPDVDAVFIAAPPILHREATLAALQAGKHVFCQARMARNYAEARDMYVSSTHTSLRTMLCPPPHAMPSDFVVKRLLHDEHFVGRPLEVHVYGILDTYADQDAPLHWRQDAEISGFNTLFLGMYAEVVHRWLGYHRRVQAITKVHQKQRRNPSSGELVDVKIADSIAIATEMENGAITSWHVAGTSLHPQPSRLEVHGTEGTLVVDLGAGAASIQGARNGETLRDIPIPAEERREWTAEADFIRAIREGGPVSPDFVEGIKYMEFTEAVYRSSAESRAIELPFEPDLVAGS